MSGDLSLSGALGGLRIANPDDSTLASPTSPAPNESAILSPLPISSHSSNDTVTLASPNLLPAISHETSGETGGVLGFDPDSYTLRHGGQSPASSQHSTPPAPSQTDTFPHNQRLAHRQSMPMAHQAQQHMQYPSYQSDPNQQFRHPSAQGVSTRPASGIYQLSNTSSSSNRSYGYRDDLGSSDSGVPGLGRTGSSRRVSPGMMVAGVPSRESSRAYHQGGQHLNGGNGPLPPRRNSKRVRAPTNGSGNGYDAGMYEGSTSTSNNAEEWREKGAAVGMRQETDTSGQVQMRAVKKGVKDFDFGRTLGEGSYSTVLAATDRQTSKEFAIKVLDKRHIIKEKKVKYVNIERDTLNRLTEHPGIVRLYYTFQDERSLYFVLDLASGGELLGVLKKMGSFDVECSRFYSAQILDSVSYMHSRGVIHRDLKPENVLLDRDMHTKITDFGTAKILADPKFSGFAVVPSDPTDGAQIDRAVSFVGTAEYVSPELLRDKNACKASDLWAFGCIVYQLLAGRPPFKAANEYLTFQKILSLEYSFPDGFPPVARDLVERLLVLEPANRLPVEHIKNHAFFDDVQWGKSLWRQKAPRLKPYVSSAAEPIKLNGAIQQRSTNAASFAPPAQAAQQAYISSQQRPQLRGITELPPPSQLDIDWSPVLTGSNERILKLGNLTVTAGPAQHANSPGGSGGAEPVTPSDKPKFRSFFSSSGNSKRRERLVLITSKGRVVVCPAGGNDQRIKMEISLLSGSWKSFVDAKGLTGWQYDNREKHLTFEDPRATTMDPSGSKFSTQEWLDAVENAREIAQSTPTSQYQSYSGEAYGSTDEGFGGDAATPPHVSGGGHSHHLKQTLRRAATEDDTSRGMGGLGRKRFSKRHSKSGLAAVF